jgi:acetylornithine deacetylase
MKLLLALLAFNLLKCQAEFWHQERYLLGDGAFDGHATALIDLHKGLIEHESITGGEHNVALYLGSYLNASGYTVEFQLVDHDRLNIFAYQGRSRQTRLLVTSHIDTVPPFIPYERRDGKVWGRGSADAKGSVAAQVTAVGQLHDQGIIKDGDVALLYVVGEERGGAGMQAANALGLSWESVVFGEPTELKLARGHKGGLGFRLVAHGRAGHSGYPELGRNAIDLLVEGLSTINHLQLPWSDEFGNTTLNVGQIEGGVAPNVIPQNATATAAVRVAVEDIVGIKQQIAKAVAAVSPWLEVDFLSGGIGPVRIDADIEG